ncbi:MAG: flagellar hook protein FlgE [Chloroflexi bacterium]|nr:MAG: flagellar hook protein FlgE [Chloroflexota bacterium]RLT50322.1 MAG: flagellar hook protein FlgE [Chloroflexota bacterium]
MIRSFYSAVTGLAGNQTYTDVVANNLANINTVGFHRSRVDIETLISHLKRSGTPPTEALGGINASQVGAGMSIGSISKVFTQGALQETGRPMDVAIDGDGFMIVDDGTRTRAFTRDGQLQMDVDGNLVQSVSGYKVMGYAPGGQPAPATETAAAGADPDALTATDTAAAAAAAGATPPPPQLQALRIPVGDKQAVATTKLKVEGNLDVLTAAAGTTTSTVAVYDSLGEAHNITLTFTRGTVPGSWTWKPASTDKTVTSVTADSAALEFDTNGGIKTGAANVLTLQLSNGSAAQSVALDFSSINQLAQPSAVSESEQDGMPQGTVTGMKFDGEGKLYALYSNGLSKEVGQLALANFVNPGGLLDVGQNNLRPWLNSGEQQLGRAGDDNFGTVAPGNVEGSNVDLSTEFTQLILARRGFQANSRVVTTSDEMIQELLNMKR